MLRLGIYVDDVYRRDRTGRVSTDRAFLLFACAVGRQLGRATLFGRAVESDTVADYVLGRDVDLVALPHYHDLKDAWSVAGAAAGTARAMWRGLDDVDAVWIFGPHPFGFLLITLAVLRRRPVVLGVRQDTMGYARARYAGRRRRRVALAAIGAMDAAHRLLARRLAATLVGPRIAAQYGDRSSHLVMTVSLIPSGACSALPSGSPPRPSARLLTIGRLEEEKNPLLVVEMLADLERRRPGRQQLVWIGRGPLEQTVRDHARELGVDRLIDLRGYVPFGEELLDHYRRADVLVHVALTEGVPQVLVEALAMGTPIVATAVGAVAELLDGGEAGVLVAPADREALVRAVERVADDAALRERLTRRGLDLAADLTVDAQSARVARFIAAAIGRR